MKMYRFCRLVCWCLAKLVFRFQVIHPERLVKNGGVLICANHVSYLDPPLIGIASQEPLYYLARKTLFSNALARWLFPKLNCVPVDQEKAEIGPLKTVMRLLKEGKSTLIFPEGSRSWDGKLSSAEPGAGFIVAKTGALVQPMRVFGAFEALPRGRGGLRIRKVTVVVGEPLRFAPEEIGRGKEAYQKISDRILEAIAALECPPHRLPKPRVLPPPPNDSASGSTSAQ